jgi:LysW-gamma-L-lysine carboxypeptidase
MEREAAIALVHGLVAIPSLSGQEAEASRWLVGEMRRAGFDLAFVDDAGNAVGELGDPSASRTIVLLGHIDTVPGNIPVRIDASSPARPARPASGRLDSRELRRGPAEAAAGREGGLALYGRGSVDAKGPLAAFVVGAARFGALRARAANLRVVVVGAVEEEAATSKGARHAAARFDGIREPRPSACVIGEPSHWRRVTLGYKGRLLLDVTAAQPMAHTAGPDASVAAVVVDLWNWVTAHAVSVNTGKDKVFDQLSPSLRRFVTSTDEAMHERAEAGIGWRLPPGFDAEAFVPELVGWTARHVGCATNPLADSTRHSLAPGDAGQGVIRLDGARTVMMLRFRGWERPWRGDRANPIVRSFIAAIATVDPTAQPGFVLKTGTSDMNVVGPVWQCPIVAYGPGDSALDHTPNEHLLLDEYWNAVRVVEEMLVRFARE